MPSPVRALLLLLLLAIAMAVGAAVYHLSEARRLNARLESFGGVGADLHFVNPHDDRAVQALHGDIHDSLPGGSSAACPLDRPAAPIA